MSVKKRLLSIVFLVCLTQRVFSVEPGLPSIIVLSDHIANVVVVDLSKGLFSLLEHKDGELFLVKTVDTSIGKQGYDKFYDRYTGELETNIEFYEFASSGKPMNEIVSFKMQWIFKWNIL